MAADHLSKKNPDGTVLGQSATDLIGFWGATPGVQMTTIVSIGSTNSTAVFKARINSIRTSLRRIGLMA